MQPSVSQLRSTALGATLRSCQLFSGMSSADLEEVVAFAVLRTLEKGEYLFREGTPSEGFYVVQRGAINVHRVNPAGKEQVISVFRDGQSFAEATVAMDIGYPADARALEPSSVVLLPKGPLVALIGRKPDLALRMLVGMSMHLRTLVGLVEDMTRKDVETRLLHWLDKRLPPDRTGPAEVKLGVTKRVLAAEIGTSSETLSRTFARLRDDGLLTVKGGTLQVHACAALRERFRKLLGEG